MVSAGEDIGVVDVHMPGASEPPQLPSAGMDLPYERARDEAIAIFQRQYVANLLSHADGNVSRAAAAAGITRGALYGIMKKLGMDEGKKRRRRR